jgi:hypothetical protein
MTTFATPAAVLRDERLDEDGMRAVLEAWLSAARRTNRASVSGQGRRATDALAALAELDRLIAAGGRRQ